MSSTMNSAEFQYLTDQITILTQSVANLQAQLANNITLETAKLDRVTFDQYAIIWTTQFQALEDKLNTIPTVGADDLQAQIDILQTQLSDKLSIIQYQKTNTYYDKELADINAVISTLKGVPNISATTISGSYTATEAVALQTVYNKVKDLISVLQGL